MVNDDFDHAHSLLAPVLRDELSPQALLAAPAGHDLQKVREVLLALWVLVGDVAGDARTSLAEVGALLTTSLEQRDLAGARRALAAARAWLAEHQWGVAARLRRPFG